MRRLGLVVMWFISAAVVVGLHPDSGDLPSRAWAARITQDPEHAITVAAAGAAWLLAGWLVLVLGLALLAEAASGASAAGRLADCLLRRLAPAVVRHAVRSMVGAVLVLAPAGPALASAAPAAVTMADAQALPSVPPPVVAPPEPLPSLDWPLTRVTAAQPTDLPTTTRAPSPPPSDGPKPTPNPAATASRQPSPPLQPLQPLQPTSHHRVASGDTLWTLAAAELPPSATGAEIIAAWQAIYAANRSVIGPDPGLLLPGQQLVIPSVLR